MGTANLSQKPHENGPSTFALLVDDINKMSELEQKLLWIQINKEKLSSFAKKLDSSVLPNNFLPGEIDDLINEARKHARSTKKG